MNMTTRMGIRTRIGWARGLCALLLGALTAAHALASGTLVYSGTNILERWQNDGGFNSENTMTVTLSGDNFTNSASTDFIAGGQVTVSNMPYGLSPVVTRTATNTVTISLAGFANTNGPAATTNGLQFIFNDKAFSNGPASAITWASGTNLTVSFLPVSSNWYVNGSSGYDTQGTGANQGNGSASYPWKSITNALAHAQSSANDVINIAAGTYTGPVGTSGSPINKIVTFNGAGPANTIVQAAAQPGVVTNTPVFNYTSSYCPGCVQNLTVQNGRAATGGGINDGAGQNSYTPYFGSDLIVSNCIFQNNTATNASNGNGGAIYHSSNKGGVLTLLNSIFTNNTASGSGGAVEHYTGNLIVSNCTFSGNTATNTGGAVFLSTGGAAIYLFNTLFANNVALTNSGGAIYEGSASGYYPLFTFTGCTFANNTAATLGGALIVSQTYVALVNSTFTANHAGVSAGVMYQSSNSGLIAATNCTFFANSASATGGCFYTSQNILLNSSIVAGNTAGLAGSDIYSTSGIGCYATNSLVGTTNGTASLPASFKFGLPNASGNYCGNAQTNAAPGLYALAWNGGILPTCALQPTSVAIHHGANPLGLAYDERGAGFARTNAAGQTDMGAYEFGAGAPRFVYSATLWNGLADGSIITTNQITLGEGIDAFSGTVGQDFVGTGRLVASNYPAGLTVTATRTSATNLNVTMTGNASSLAAVSNLTFVFQPGALVTDSVVTDAFNYAVTNLQMVFVQGAPALTYGGTVFTESSANNGAIGNTLSITLANDSFNGNVGDNFVSLGRVTVANLPSGLTAQLVLNDVNKKILTASLVGNATAHNASNDIANLTFAFLNSAFQSSLASSVSNAVVSNLQVQYLNPVLTYASKTFNESWMNDGSIANTISASLAGDSFSGTNGENFVASGKVTPVNVPGGLTAVVTMSTTQALTIALLGNASPNTSAQNTGSLGFTFANNAFAGNTAAIVTNYNESDLAVAFLSQNATNWYVSTSGVDTNAYNGAITQPFRTVGYALTRIQSGANDTIHLLPGTYAESNLTISANLTITGNTRDDTFLQPWPTPFAAPNLTIFGIAANVTLKNLTLRYANASGSGAAIWIRQFDVHHHCGRLSLDPECQRWRRRRDRLGEQHARSRPVKCAQYGNLLQSGRGRRRRHLGQYVVDDDQQLRLCRQQRQPRGDERQRWRRHSPRQRVSAHHLDVIFRQQLRRQCRRRLRDQ